MGVRHPMPPPQRHGAFGILDKSGTVGYLIAIGPYTLWTRFENPRNYESSTLRGILLTFRWFRRQSSACYSSCEGEEIAVVCTWVFFSCFFFFFYCGMPSSSSLFHVRVYTQNILQVNRLQVIDTYCTQKKTRFRVHFRLSRN